MVNIKHEQSLVQKFIDISQQYEIEIKHCETNSTSKHMDCEFVCDGEYIRVEAKQFSDTRNSSQNFIKIFGGIMKGRSLPLFFKSSLPVVYGVLIDEAELKKFKNFKGVISTCDWSNFGKIFEVKYVITVSDGEIEFHHWNSL